MNLLFEDASVAEVAPMSFAEFDECASQSSQTRGGSSAPEDGLDAGDGKEFEAELEAALEQGREEMRDLCEKRLHDGLETERSAVAHVCGSFLKARERYFAEVEGEVVRLALAVAARVLQREVAMDPLLLTGVVRVALSRLSDAEGAVLHVPAADAERWAAAMRLCAASLKVEADERMEAGDCVLEAAAGVAELGVKAQLVEIERGFFDLLARRPA